MKILVNSYFGSVVAIGVPAFAAIALANSVATHKSSEQRADTRSNLKQLGMALMMYVADYDEFLPPMKNAVQVHQVLSPYLENLKSKSAFINPHTKKPFAVNPSLSGRWLNAVYKEGYQKKQGVIAFYEAAPRANGARFVLRMPRPHSYKTNGSPVWAYPDGLTTVESVSQLQWLKVKKTFNLP